MGEGDKVIIHSIFSVWELLFFLSVLITLIFILPLFLTNPCWRDFGQGLQYLATPVEGTPELILDAECVESVTFTPDPKICEIACGRASTEAQRQSCATKCWNLGEYGEKSFIVAIPKNQPLGAKVRKAISDNLLWLYEGRAIVIAVNCQIQDVRIDEDRCDDTIPGEWLCKPLPDDEKENRVRYYLDIQHDRNLCNIIQRS